MASAVIETDAGAATPTGYITTLEGANLTRIQDTATIAATVYILAEEGL